MEYLLKNNTTNTELTIYSNLSQAIRDKEHLTNKLKGYTFGVYEITRTIKLKEIAK